MTGYFREVRTPQSVQPRHTATLDRTSPLHKKINGAFNAALVDPTWVPTGGAVTKEAGPGGVAVAANGSSSYLLRTRSAVETNPLWMMCSFVAPATSTAALVLYALGDSVGAAAAAQATLQIGDAATGNGVRFAMRSTSASGPTGSIISDNGSLVEGRVYTVVVRVPDGTVSNWTGHLNGVNFHNGSGGPITLPGGSSLYNEAIGALVRGTASLFSGYKVLCTAYGIGARGMLTVAEASSLSLNPWQIFEPQTRKIWVPVSAGGGISGVLASTLAAVTSAATGTVALKGTSAPTLENLTSSATGTVALKADFGATLGALTLSSAGTVAIKGDVSTTLGSLTAAATGTVALGGTLGATLGDLTVEAAGTSQTVTAGTLTSTLADATLASTATLLLKGSASITLGDCTIVATGTMPQAGISGATDQTLDALTSAATGRLSITGSVGATLANCTVVAAGGDPSTDTNSAWWTYSVAADDLNYSVPADDLTYSVGIDSLAYSIGV